jgi:hypothetical protein
MLASVMPTRLMILQVALRISTRRSLEASEENAFARASACRPDNPSRPMGSMLSKCLGEAREVRYEPLDIVLGMLHSESIHCSVLPHAERL